MVTQTVTCNLTNISQRIEAKYAVYNALGVLVDTWYSMSAAKLQAAQIGGTYKKVKLSITTASNQ